MEFLSPPQTKELFDAFDVATRAGKTRENKSAMVSRRMSTPAQMPDEYAERWRNSVQSHTAIVKQLWRDSIVVGNLERARAGERDIRVRDEEGVTRCLASTSMICIAPKFRNPSLRRPN